MAPSAMVQRRHRPDYQILLFIGILMLLGLVVMYAIGPQRAQVLNSVHGTDFYSSTYFAVKQFISLALALGAFATLALLPFALLKKHSFLFVKIGLGLSAALFLFGNVLHIDSIALPTLGAYRWFNLGPLGTFQPAEVLKFALLLYMAAFLGQRYREGKINDLQATVYPMVGLAALALFVVVVLQRDMGTGVAIGSMIAMMFVVSKMDWRILAKLALIAVVIGSLLIVATPHRRDRLMTFMQGDHASGGIVEDDSNYHINNAMIALGSGGIAGRGIGNSVQATGYLPEAINDSIFAIMGEIFGFIGTTVIVGVFGALLLRLLRIVDHLVDMSMRLVVAGVFGWLAAHVVLNIASMLGMMPLTGITLPLLSFGGTSMIFITGALGLAFQMSRYTTYQPVEIKEGSAYEDSRSRRGVGRSRYARGRRT